MAFTPPDKLKSLSMYLKAAAEHDKRDPVIAYYCRLYAVQKGMEIDRKSPESKQFLTQLMDHLDQMKNQRKDDENITNETIAHAYVEHYALKLFDVADQKDRASDFGQATVKSFYIAGLLMDVLGVFGEVGEEIEKCRKYAKWKALYINQCVKNGEQPQPGPLEEDGAAEAPNMNLLNFGGGGGAPSVFPASGSGPSPAPPGFSLPPAATPTSQPAAPGPFPSPRTNKPLAEPVQAPAPTPHSSTPGTAGAVALRPEDFSKAEKYCKYAISALQYQDSQTAIDYMTKCLNLLTTGQDT